MERRPPYSYSPLATGSIRLFDLKATAADGNFGLLKTTSLDEAPPYYALSYAWGAETQHISIQVDGKVLYVTSSLAAGLRQLQALATERPVCGTMIQWIWIDKICINQDDVSERSRQVRLMGRIYSSAVQTLIWLGPTIEPCSAFVLIDQIYGVFQKENPCAMYLADVPFQLYSDQRHIALGLPAWHNELWQRLVDLLRLPWFTRTWIVQEVVLSRADPVIIYGPHRYPWHRLGWASSWLRRNGYLRLPQVPSQMQNIDTMSNLRRSSACWPLEALLLITSVKCHAGDPRDKVYALLGLAAEYQNLFRLPNELYPDYELDVVQVYTRVGRLLLRNSETLALLSRASGLYGEVSWPRQRKFKLEHLPSWVPDWSDFAVTEREVAKNLSWISHPNTAGPATLGFLEQYNASAGLRVKVLEASDPSLLQLCGLQADQVATATRFDEPNKSKERYAHAPPLLALWKAATPHLPTRGAAEDRIHSWIKVTTADQHDLGGRSKEQIIQDGSAYLVDLMSSHPSCSGESQVALELLRELSASGDPRSYAFLAGNFCLHRTFIITVHGHIGLGPVGAQPGDLVAVLFGGGVPYILREQERGWLFVGESYIDGLMNGEAVQAWQRGELTEEIFELR